METAPSDSQIERRTRSRLRLGIPARLRTLDGCYRVRLDDLSQTGAHISRPRDDRLSKAVLEWLDLDAFGEVVWQRGGYCGVVFDEPLAWEWIQRTRAASAALLRNPDGAVRSAASEWVAGGLHVGSER